MEKDMEKTKSQFSLVIKYIAIILVLVFCSTFFVGCMSIGGGGGSSNNGGESEGNGGESNTDDKEEDDKPKNPYAGAAENTIQNFNDVFIGAIGVYDVGGDQPVFYDNYAKTNVTFDWLVDRQFTTLAKVIVNSLNYAYGTNAGNDTNISISGYGVSGTTKSISANSVVTSPIYNNDPGLYYKNTINGGYELKEKEVFDHYETYVDADGNTSQVPVYRYEYAYDFTSGSWANDHWSVSNLDISTISTAFKNIYTANKTKNVDASGNINVIGFNEEFKESVETYIEEKIIGTTLISASTTAGEKVFNGDTLCTIDRVNYVFFDDYKGYEVIIPKIVDNAFKLIISSNTLTVDDNYCYASDNDDWDKTLFPSLARYEFLYYENIDDLCDAEANQYTDDPFDPETEEPKSDEELEEMFGDLKHEDGEEISKDEAKAPVPVPYKVGSKKKLKEIILLPYIDPNGKYGSKEGNDTFTFAGINIAFAKESSDPEYRVEIKSTVKDDNGNAIDNKQVKLDDGTYASKMGPVTNVKESDLSKGDKITFRGVEYVVIRDEERGDKYYRQEEVDGKTKIVQYLIGEDRVDFVTEEGYIKIQHNKGVNSVSLFPVFHSDQAEGEAQKLSADLDPAYLPGDVKKYVFGDCVTDEKFFIGTNKSSFKNEYEPYVKDADGKEIKMHRINVWNQLIKIGTNGYEINFDNNFIKFNFNYYDANNNQLSTAPELYLMNLTFRD